MSKQFIDVNHLLNLRMQLNEVERYNCEMFSFALDLDDPTERSFHGVVLGEGYKAWIEVKDVFGYRCIRRIRERFHVLKKEESERTHKTYHVTYFKKGTSLRRVRVLAGMRLVLW